MRLLPRAALAALLALATPLAAPAVTMLGATAQPRLATTLLTLVTAGGKHPYRVELARTPEEQARGMMFRTRLARGEGMLFPFDPPREAAFWMENTPLPLDLVFIGTDGRVLNIAARAVPYSRAMIPSRGVAAAVLELNGGEAARIGLKPGDRALYRLP